MRRRLLAAALAGLAAGAADAANASPLRFDRVFAATGEPASLHYHVRFEAGGAAHQLDVWRDRDLRVKRVTDRAITTYAFHQPGDAGYRLAILDVKRRISTRIDRTNLYRIGNFTDWFDLGHGLRHPKGLYALSHGAGGARPGGLGDCRWYDLTQGGRVTHICWDAADRLPLLIVSADRRTLWRVTAIDRGPIPAATFIVRDQGYVRDDADRDIEND